jgi:soluble lytic murein transglycosylase-like protein
MRASPHSLAAALVAGTLLVPITSGSIGIPMEAMNVSVSERARRLARESHRKSQAANGTVATPISAVAHRRLQERQLAILSDTVREEFFRTNVPYGSIIYREAKRNGLKPELVAAMVVTESDFRPTLISHKSALGLMQIIPSTVRLQGIADPFDPAANISAGTQYFRDLLSRLGTERLALAAYKAGEGNVGRFGGVPPFPETRSYIERVNRRTIRYRSNLNRYVEAQSGAAKPPTR